MDVTKDCNFETDRPLICVQGLGFVGLAVSTVVANTFNTEGSPKYNVVGIDLPNREKFYEQINNGILPFKCEDIHFESELKRCTQGQHNFLSTSETHWLKKCEIVICDVNLDFDKSKGELKDAPYLNAIKTIGENIKEDTVVIIESTVPPLFCQKRIIPILAKCFKKRGMATLPQVCHSYERVMPGKDYLNSIRILPRSISSDSKQALQKGNEFLKSILNPETSITISDSTATTEIAKVLENSYRAMNIAFIHEWTKLAEQMEVNLFEVVESIRTRPTHKNIMAPGLGVGGYCLTKDTALADWSAKNLLEHPLSLPFSMEAIAINDGMPLHTANIIRNEIDLKAKKILVMGVSYREDVGDTRYSPTEILVKELLRHEADIYYYDPYVPKWMEMTQLKSFSIHEAEKFDIIILCTRHKQFMNLKVQDLLKISNEKGLVVDAFNIINDDKINELLQNNRNVIGVGKGHIKKLKRGLPC